MKIWQKDIILDQRIENFTIGLDKTFDLQLAKYDIIASIAHVQMLQKVGLLTEEEGEALVIALKELEEIALNGNYLISEDVEDIHSQIENDLIKKLGDTGKKVHMGRSRNDQVLVALKLYYRAELDIIHNLLKENIETFIAMAKEYKSILMPGYTHMQVGMVSSFGLWFSSFAEALVDDANLLLSNMDIIDQNPLGSSAGYGNSFPLDRQLTTTLLAFNSLHVNSIYAQTTRGKSELWIGQIVASIAISINRFATDVCMFCNENYKFISLPDNVTTGSSIMPHKKNPDVFELIRAKCNQLITVPNQITMIISNLPSGYNRDVQSLKEIIFPAIAMIQDVLSILNYIIPQIEVNKSILDDPKYDYLFSVEEVNQKVLEGMPFRDAYLAVAKDIQYGNFKPSKEVSHTAIGSIGNLGLDRILRKLNSDPHSEIGI
ncbi:MAG: argininosuccinate lyase [Saprospiraceae bacterium]|jgi:argininosuccinate lyase|tara:strand:- start:1268 stop:2566 length:1299 start_codon:yes stop_codon:yes gene_type:complete